MKKIKFFKKIENWFMKSQIRRNGFWFVDIPRTSSTSLKYQLGQKYGKAYAKTKKKDNRVNHNGYFPDHMDSKKMIGLLGKEIWDNLYTFSVIRNPWDRAVSLHQYFLNSLKPGIVDKSFKKHLYMLKEMHYKDNLITKPLFRGCYDFISYDNEIVVKKIIRFENRKEELKEVAQELGFQDLGAVHNNKILGQKSYNEFYDNETKNIIEDIYSKDIEEFGYSFE